MTTLLFTWAPEYYEELYGHYDKWLAQGFVDVPNWACATKSATSNVRAFFLAQKTERRGVFVRGMTTSSARTPGTNLNANDIDVRLEEFSDPRNPLIPIEKLLMLLDQKKGPYFRQSGVVLAEDVAEKLEVVWRQAWNNRLTK